MGKFYRNWLEQVEKEFKYQKIWKDPWETRMHLETKTVKAEMDIEFGSR